MEKSQETEQTQTSDSILKKIDLFFCPNCLLNLTGFQEYDLNSLSDNKKLRCRFCQNEFFTIKCYHCKRRHFFRDNCNIDGINIKCQYNDCGQYYSRSSCPECKKNLYFPDKYQEGSLVKCPFKDCGKDFSKIICPNKICRGVVYFKNGIYKNEIIYREGLMVSCKKENCDENFYKLNCFHCLRRLVWFYPRNFLDGQKITCPYEDCLMAFNKIFCPHCQKCNIYKKGKLEMGSKVTCIYKECNKSFNKIFCPHCMKTNIFLNGDYIEGIKTTCVYSNCTKNFQMISCSQCKQINVWKNANYLIGQSIICSYENCRNKFSKVNCPHCNKLNLFPEGNYSFGITYKCIYGECRKEFANFICPACRSGLNLKGGYLEGNKVICGVKECQANFYNFKCPFCFGAIFDLGAKYKFGQNMKCPYESCKKIFNYIFCYKCKKGIYYKFNEYEEGNLIKCPNSGCGENFFSIYCSYCDRINQYTGDYKKNKGKGFECGFNDCKMQFEPKRINQTFYEDGLKFIPSQGTTIYFDPPEKEINENNIMEVFKDSRKFYSKEYLTNDEACINTNDQIGASKQYSSPQTECYICRVEVKESVFVPCGHRCVCYECGLKIMKNYHQCPICKQEVLFLLRKVYD